jgi:hypothetical protein
MDNISDIQSHDSLDGLLGSYQRLSLDTEDAGFDSVTFTTFNTVSLPGAGVLEEMAKNYTLSVATMHFCYRLLSFTNQICVLLSANKQGCAIGAIVSLVDVWSKSLLAAFSKPKISEKENLLLIQDLAFMTKKILPYIEKKVSPCFGSLLEEIEMLCSRLKKIRDDLIDDYCKKKMERVHYNDTARSAIDKSYVNN